jgi:hypothetical protein
LHHDHFTETAVGDTEGNSSTTPTEFLDQLGSDLAVQSEIDLDLAKILTTNILSASPKSDCVTSALRAISDLAKARAALPPKGA